MKLFIFKSIMVLLFGILSTVSLSAQAAAFNLFYDDVDDGIVDFTRIVGTGTFSYDGPAVAGEFLLSELTGVSYSSTFNGISGASNFSGPPFNPSDLSLIGISVSAIGASDFELIFTGSSASTNGSLDIGLLSHEPGRPGVGPRRYFAQDGSVGLDVYGDYIATSVPEPAHWMMLLAGLGIMGSVVRRRRTNAS